MTEDTRDPNFVCSICNGTLVEIGKLPDGRKTYNCDGCGENIVHECIKCHRPRNVDGVGRCLKCTMDLVSSNHGAIKKS